MADLIDLHRSRSGDENLIAAQPLELRRGDWPSGYALMCTREESECYESHRAQALSRSGHRHLKKIPNHFALSSGFHYTFLGLLRHHRSEADMRRVYRLAGLMECMVNTPSPVLRSDLLRRFYESILEEREALQVFWRGSTQHFLFPIDPCWYNPNLFTYRAGQAATLKDLYHAIESETSAQFDILCREYVFYVPLRLMATGRE